MTDSSGPFLMCPSHGSTLWLGHIVCECCGHVYQTKHSDQPHFATAFCPACKKRLLPKDGEPFCARAICAECFKSMVKITGEHDGTLPV